MSARKSERLLNLLIMLLVQRRYVPKEQIRRVLYPETRGDAFDRMFDRDKEELRALGIPIQVGALSAFHEDEVGYRIRPDELALPEIDLTPEEASVLTLAGKVWHHATLADTTASALRKLMPTIPTDAEVVPALAEPVIDAEEPSFDAFWTAIQERRVVTFNYRKAGQVAGEQRKVEPWGLVRHSGRWYVVGRDVALGERRTFRLTRVEDGCSLGRTPDAYLVPDDLDLREVVATLQPSRESVTAQVLVRAGTGHALRRRGQVLETAATGPDGSREWERVEVTGEPRAIADEVLTLGEHAWPESPVTLRAEVRERLAALADTFGEEHAHVVEQGGER